MNIIDHGRWVPYKPDKSPKDAPANAMYLRREGDGVDWYDYVRPSFLHSDKTNFTPDSVVCNVYHHKHLDVHVVGSATRDPTAVVPFNQRVIEIVGFEGDDPLTEFSGKVYNQETKTFTELVING